jgi:hypothetical protein
MTKALPLACLALSLAAAPAAAQETIADRLRQLTRGAAWTEVATITLPFRTHHPQGMTRVGDRLYLSTVQIDERTQRYDTPRDGMDRTPGRGRGHLYELDAEGRLLRTLTADEGDIYHPGGIDYDGTHIWMPVAEYRPNSRSIIYRVNPATMQAEEMFRFADHIGGVAMDRDSNTLYGVSWGSRRFYAWPLGADGKPTNAGASPESLRRPNPSHYIDYQDCESVGGGLAVCSGLNNYRPMGASGPAFALGGVELVDLARGQAVFQLPIELWTETGLPFTQNPFFVALQGNGLRFWFAPEDDRTRLFIYDVVAR